MFSPVTSQGRFLWDQMRLDPSWMETPKPRENKTKQKNQPTFYDVVQIR